jgi:major membrane immunogen (membrane-anchored lipoprotein)
VRIAFCLISLVFLAACNKGKPTNEAIRQGVLDHLKTSSVNVAAMDMDLTSVDFNGGNKADVTVTFRPKGGPAAAGMALHYQMQEKSGRWAVVGIQDSGHSSSTAPGTPNPHGAGAEASSDSHGEVPSLEDLPPTKK